MQNLGNRQLRGVQTCGVMPVKDAGAIAGESAILKIARGGYE